MPLAILATVVDNYGLSGRMVHHSFSIALGGSALFIFILLWKKGRLDMDEDPKYQMMLNDSPNLKVSKVAYRSKTKKSRGDHE